LLSLTAHLALLASRLPRLKSEGDEDPLFDDDWAASTFLYPRQQDQDKGRHDAGCSRPPVTLLVMAVGGNVIFDPAMEELAVADVALAVSVGEDETPASQQQRRQKEQGENRWEGVPGEDVMHTSTDDDRGSKPSRSLRLLSVRTIDPPSRLTPPGVPNAANAAYGAAMVGGPAAAGAGTGNAAAGTQARQERKANVATETEPVEGVWRAPRGGSKVAVMAALVQKVLEKGGVADEVLDGLEAVELG